MKVAIYKITNTINGKMYIGCSAKPEIRIEHHLNSKSMTNYNKYLRKDVIKFGKDNFKYEILNWYDNRKQGYIEEEKLTYKIGLHNLYNIVHGGIRGNKDDRGVDYIKLSNLWKNDGIKGLVNFHHSTTRTGYDRLKLILGDGNFGSKAELKKLVLERKEYSKELIKLNYKIKRDNDFDTLYNIWKTKGIKSILELKYPNSNSDPNKNQAYFRLLQLMKNFGYSTKEELTKLKIEYYKRNIT